MKAKEEYVDAPRETRSKDITVYAIIFLVLLVGAGIFLADQLVHAAAEAEISLYNKCPHDFVLLCEKRLLCGRSGAGPRPY